jgi:lysylphosphatidylglycerol synthetase-like protein (DUF2156 family)
MFFYIVAAGFFLALMCLTAWIFSHLSGTNFLIDSNDITHLARVKLLSVMASFAGCFVALFIAYAVIVTSTPFLNQRIFRYNGMILAIAFFAGLLSPLLYFAAQGRLLARWLPNLVCPYCEKEIDLIAPWPCAGGCKTTMRHVLAPCLTCNTQMKGMVCDYCHRQIIFTDSYNEREIVNRGKRHTTVMNHYFISALIAIYVSVLGMYHSWQAEDTVWLYICAALAVAAIITLIFQRPKTLVTNHHNKKSESVEEWLRNQRR